MSDFNSGLPIRSEIPGQANYNDIIVKIGDATNPTTQQLGVDSSGRVTTKLNDGTGNAITSQTVGAQRALDVFAAQGSAAATHASPWWVRLTDGTSDSTLAPASTAAAATQAAVVVALSPNSPLPTGTNTIGAVNQGTSPWITKDQSDGSVTGGAAGTFSSLAGAVYTSTLPTLTTGQQVGLQVDANGRLITRFLTSATDTVVSNQGTAGSAAQGWFTKITDGISTVAVKAANIPAVATDPALVVTLSPNNQPIQVAITTDNVGTEIDAFNTATAAGNATSNHDYTVTTGKNLLLTQIEATSSGRMKIEIQVETAAASGVFNTKFVQFNSSSSLNLSLHIEPVISVPAGARVRVIRTNREVLSQDVYSTIGGQELP